MPDRPIAELWANYGSGPALKPWLNFDRTLEDNGNPPPKKPPSEKAPQSLPGRALSEWFQKQDDDPSDDIMNPDGTREVYMNEYKAKQVIEKLGLAFDIDYYTGVTSSDSYQAYKGMNRSMFVDYVSLICGQAPCGDDCDINLGNGFYKAVKTKPGEKALQVKTYENYSFNFEIKDVTKGYYVYSTLDNSTYFCSHTNYILSEEIGKKNDFIGRDRHGDPLTGFIHIPGRRLLQYGGPEEQLFKATQDVLAGALRGYYEDLDKQKTENAPLRFLITGYGPFGSEVKRNPTGIFVSQWGNIDAIMQKTFGKRLLTKEGRAFATPAGIALRYLIKDPKDSSLKVTIEILPKMLETCDDAINGGASSLQAAVASFRPQGILSLGVDPGAESTFTLLSQASNMGLKEVGNGFNNNPGEPETFSATRPVLFMAVQRGKKLLDKER